MGSGAGYVCSDISCGQLASNACDGVLVATCRAAMGANGAGGAGGAGAHGRHGTGVEAAPACGLVGSGTNGHMV